MKIDHLDHLLLTVASIDAAADFYTRVLGLEPVTFGEGRKALTFGNQKINLHERSREIEPKADQPTPGSADLCFITTSDLADVAAHLDAMGVAIVDGPVDRTGAMGPLRSIYIRDPDRNLIEIANDGAWPGHPPPLRPGQPCALAHDLIIVSLDDAPRNREALREILTETVAEGGSVSFMHPLAPQAADAFWEASLDAAARGERLVLGAFEADDLVGTVTLLLDFPPNQPHRAEIAKLMTRSSRRGRGVATALMRAAEREAVARSKTLLVLDTAQDGGASRLYEKLGFSFAGVIPDFALKPHGGLTATMIYWKRLPANVPVVTDAVRRS